MFLLFYQYVIWLYKFLLGVFYQTDVYLRAANGLTPLSKLDNCKNRLISILKNQILLKIYFILIQFCLQIMTRYKIEVVF
jgi:hypothetical protein